jgi:hypothetical protein
VLLFAAPFTLGEHLYAGRINDGFGAFDFEARWGFGTVRGY